MRLTRYYPALICLLLALLALAEPALANKFTTIGGGVSGTDREKLQLLQIFAGIFGLFFIFLGFISMVPQFRGLSMLKVPEVTFGTSIGIIIFGLLLGSLYFL